MCEAKVSAAFYLLYIPYYFNLACVHSLPFVHWLRNFEFEWCAIFICLAQHKHTQEQWWSTLTASFCGTHTDRKPYDRCIQVVNTAVPDKQLGQFMSLLLPFRNPSFAAVHVLIIFSSVIFFISQCLRIKTTPTKMSTTSHCTSYS